MYDILQTAFKANTANKTLCLYITVDWKRRIVGDGVIVGEEGIVEDGEDAAEMLVTPQ